MAQHSWTVHSSVSFYVHKKLYMCLLTQPNKQCTFWDAPRQVYIKHTAHTNNLFLNSHFSLVYPTDETLGLCPAAFTAVTMQEILEAGSKLQIFGTLPLLTTEWFSVRFTMPRTREVDWQAYCNIMIVNDITLLPLLFLIKIQ